MDVSIKGVEERAFRSLRSEAIKRGIKVGDATTDAFRMWVASKSQVRLREKERMMKAADDMDRIRAQGGTNWSGVDEIRRWRYQPRT